MTSDEQEQLLAELGLTEKKAVDVRDITAMLVELAYDAWSEERKNACQNKNENKTATIPSDGNTTSTS